VIVLQDLRGLGAEKEGRTKGRMEGSTQLAAVGCGLLKIVQVGNFVVIEIGWIHFGPKLKKMIKLMEEGDTPSQRLR
jgi:hypothetical protein